MPDITVGMASYNDFDGVYFTVQALRMYHSESDVEIIVVDNYGCDSTKNFIERWVKNGKYFYDAKIQGTAYPRNRVFDLASSDNVLCIDSHVMFLPHTLASLIQYYKENPDTKDIIQGPMIYDDLKSMATHMDPVWRDQMFGIWACDSRIHNSQPLEIIMHGLGLFSCRKSVWPGFNPLFSGFGGEEGYIHQKFRINGGRCLCMPWLGWVHRFGRPRGVPYTPLLVDKVKNYFLGRIELSLPTADIHEHFSHYMHKNELKKIESNCQRQMALSRLGGLKNAQ